jgi:hypothetical protein
MVEPVRHRQTKEAGTDMFEPKATAPHLDSTATKFDTKNQAISTDCFVFVFEAEPSPQQHQWLSFVGSNHSQPIAECESAAGERR